jgi:hypothetical protein
MGLKYSVQASKKMRGYVAISRFTSTHDAFISSLVLFFQEKIEHLVTAMGGLLQAKVSMDVNFVIAKDVLAAKYKVSCSIGC